MSHYLRVFNFLWRAKRMEYTLTDIWKGQMCNAKLLKTMPGMLFFISKFTRNRDKNLTQLTNATPHIVDLHVNI